jgi:thiol-disulfide isomerase/thioredoxin
LDRGVPLSASQFGDRPLLVNFWASWCVPCQKELPSLDRLAARRGDLAIVAVSVDGDRRAGARAFAGRYPHLRLGYASMAAVQAYGALGIPYSVVFDRSGRELARVPRALAWDGGEAVSYLPAKVAFRRSAHLPTGI